MKKKLTFRLLLIQTNIIWRWFQVCCKVAHLMPLFLCRHIVVYVTACFASKESFVTLKGKQNLIIKLPK